GVTADAVATHALAFWRGLRTAGVLGCGKHYPGHGDTRADSHLELPVVAHDQARLAAVELLPFAAAIAAGAEAIMTAHVMYPPLEGAALDARLGTAEHQALAASFARVDAASAAGSAVAKG